VVKVSVLRWTPTGSNELEAKLGYSDSEIYSASKKTLEVAVF